MVQRSDNTTRFLPAALLVAKVACLLLLVFPQTLQAQDNDGAKAPQYKDYNNDSTFKNFGRYRNDVAKAQINALKNGALLVRLKTNANTINRLKAGGNIDLATQIERQTFLDNKEIVRAYTKNFTFCPVYFFYSNVSDSVKHGHLEGLFLDTNLAVNSAISCTAKFYLVAEQSTLYSSSLGLLTETQAASAIERGTGFKDFAIVVKNRYFIQLHEPFPYFQKGYKVSLFGQYVKKFNDKLQAFYTKNAGYVPNETIRPYVY